MKRFIEVLALVLCLLFAGLVVAQQQPAVRIFQQTASDDASWQKYMAMQDKADIDSGFLPIHKFADQSYSTALNRGYLQLVPEIIRQPEIYKSVAVLFNNMGNRDKISFAELRELGRTTGVYLPDMRMFLKETGEGFEEFKTTVAKSVKEENGTETIPASILGVLSYLKIKDTSYLSLVSQNFREQSGSVAAFTSYNELPASVALEEFKTLGQGDGIWVPVEVEYIKAFAKAFMERAATVVRQETLLKNTSEANAGIQALQTEIARLKKLGSGEVNQARQITDLKIQLNKLVGQVGMLSQSQNQMASNQVNTLNLLNEGLVAVKAKMSEMGMVEAKIIADTDAKIDDVYSGIERVAEVVAYNEKVIVSSLSGAILAVLLIGFLVRRHDKKNIKQNLYATGERIDNLQGQILGVNFDRQAVSKQAISLLEINKVITLPVTVKDKSYEVKVARISKDNILVDGIRHHAKDRQNCHEYGIGTNVPTMIDRAASHGHLTTSLILENVKVA